MHVLEKILWAVENMAHVEGFTLDDNLISAVTVEREDGSLADPGEDGEHILCLCFANGEQYLINSKRVS